MNKKIMNFNIYRQRELLDALFFDIPVDEGRIVINCGIAPLVMIYRTIHGKTEINRFFIENKEIVCDLIKKNCYGEHSLINGLKIEDTIKAATHINDLDDIAKHNNEVLRCLFGGIFLSQDHFFKLMKTCKDNLKDEASFLTKEEFDAVLLDEFQRNIENMQF